MKVYSATITPGSSNQNGIRFKKSNRAISDYHSMKAPTSSEQSHPNRDFSQPSLGFAQPENNLPIKDEMQQDRKLLNFGSKADDLADERALIDITSKYNLATMTGIDLVNFANELVAQGIDGTEAIAVTWPINCRNLMQKVGKEAAAPKIRSWEDVIRLHRARRDIAERRAQHNHGKQLTRLIALATTLCRATLKNSDSI